MSGARRSRGPALAIALLLTVAGCAARRPGDASDLATAAERRGFASPSTSAEVGEALGRLAATGRARVVDLGTSAGGKPLRALLVGPGLDDDDGDARPPSSRTRPLTVLVVASQHGTEPSGSEAALALAREAVASGDDGTLATIDLIVLADGNPDGRDARRRVNANGVNLSTDYVTLFEPEARTVVAALLRWQPDVVIDVHESALLKRRSLGAQGYLTDFEAQLEVASNPNVDAGLRALSLDTLLPAAIDRVASSGVRAQRYVGEITDVRQPITHGGLSPRNLRNAAGLRGAVSFLIENRLDPPDPGHPTPRNLAARTDKQLRALRSLLAVCIEHADEIRAATGRARDAWRAGEPERVALAAEWVVEPDAPRVVVPLRRRDDGRLEDVEFARHTRVRTSREVEVPGAYVVRGRQDEVTALLARQGVTFTARAAGDLWITLRQPARRLIPLLLDPRSRSFALADPTWPKGGGAVPSIEAVEAVDDGDALSP